MSFHKELQKGDKVIINTNYTTQVTTVDRLTKTKIVLASGHKFNRNSGYAVGDGYNKPILNEWSQEKEDEINATNYRNKLLNYIKKQDFSRLTDDELKVVCSMFIGERKQK